MPHASPWTVYVLRCRDGSLYTGIAKDLPRRLAAHRAGRGSKYVASRRPFRLVHREPAPTKSRALRREAAIKALPKTEKESLVRRGAKLRRHQRERHP